MTEKHNPFDHRECDHPEITLMFPVGKRFSFDLYGALKVLDDLFDAGDYLGARQALWELGWTIEANFFLEDDDIEEAYVRQQVAELDKQLEGGE